MLAKLMGEDGGIKPVEGEVAPVDHFHQRIKHLRLVSHLIAEAEVLAALHETEHLHLVRHKLLRREIRGITSREYAE
jgi:hypothetical protein